jgi:hypothetical protein
MMTIAYYATRYLFYASQELVERLEQKLRQYRRQMEDAEERGVYFFPLTN